MQARTLYFLLLFFFFAFSKEVYSQKIIVDKVFKNLIEVFPVKDAPPRIEIIEDDDIVADINQFKNINTIRISQKAINICKSFENKFEDNLAFLIGHELTHHFRHSFLNSDVENRFGGFNFMENLIKFSYDSTRRLNMEFQADKEAGFYSFLAGYNSLESAPELLDSIYKIYNLSSYMKGYPPLEERKDICYKVIEEINDIKSLFKASTLALITGNNQQSIDGFKQIEADHYLSKEIFNNIGVAQLNYAIEMMNNKNMLGYPFEFDATSRLNEETRGSIYRKKEIEKVIISALEEFEKSIKYDKNYLTGQFNKICAYSILVDLYMMYNEKYKSFQIERNKELKNYKRMLASKYGNNNEKTEEKYINKTSKSLQKNNNKEFENYEILSAITLVQKRTKMDSTRAKKILSKVFKQTKDNLAKTNLDKLNNLRNNNFNNSFNYKEKIDELDPSLLFVDFDPFKKPYSKKYLNGPNTKLYTKGLQNSTAYYFRGEINKLLFHSTKILDTKKGVKIGDELDKVRNLYGNNFSVLNTIKENYVFFKNYNIIFSIKDNKVIEWTYYSKEN